VEQESDSPEEEFQSKTTPEKRVENPRVISCCKKIKRLNNIFLFV
jgi:hypothetical protein